MEEIKRKIELLEDRKLDGDFTIIKGTVPVLLSAPHTMSQLKEDCSVKSSEPYTKALALYLSEKLDCSCFIKNIDTGIDSNSDNYEEYKTELIRYIKKNNISLVLDLHGASKERNFDVELGTLNNLSADFSTIRELEEAFKENGVVNVEINEPFKGGGITRRIYASTDIDVIQIEINRKYRDLDVSNFMKIIASLEKFILFYSKKQ